jgi:hypothetical protein
VSAIAYDEIENSMQKGVFVAQQLYQHSKGSPILHTIKDIKFSGLM